MIIKINDTNFFTFLSFVETIMIDNTINKVYHLDKTKLYFHIPLIGLQYDKVKFIIKKNGFCENIKLNGIATMVSHHTRGILATKQQLKLIKQLKMVNIPLYKSGKEIVFKMEGNINGFILTNINPQIIKSIKIKLDNNIRLYYDNKIEIKLHTQFINSDTIYVNLNDKMYYDNVSNTSLNTSMFNFITLTLHLDIKNISFKIGCYSNNILNVVSGQGGNKYLISENIRVIE
jgi:hypothetical protein